MAQYLVCSVNFTGGMGEVGDSVAGVSIGWLSQCMGQAACYICCILAFKSSWPILLNSIRKGPYIYFPGL